MWGTLSPTNRLPARYPALPCPALPCPAGTDAFLLWPALLSVVGTDAFLLYPALPCRH